MKLTIITYIKHSEKNLLLTDIDEIEVVNIRWEAEHVFSFVRKGYDHYEYLKDNQEIFRLTD